MDQHERSFGAPGAAPSFDPGRPSEVSDGGDARFRDLVENGSNPIALAGPDGSFSYVSPSMVQQFGYSAQELMNLGVFGMAHGEEVQAAHEAIQELLRRPEEPVRFQVRLRLGNGSWRWTEIIAKNFLDHPTLKAILFNYYDIKEAKELADKLTHQAAHDFLTGLPNRRLFNDRFHQSLAYARRHKGRIALLFIDIDSFKRVNDTHGHAIGDLLLRQVTERMSRLLRASDTLARIGGDEFAVIASNISGPHGARIIAKKLLTAFQDPFQTGQREISVTGSIGISLFPDDGESQDVLQSRADIAMYGAKWREKNSFNFFGSAVSEEAEQRIRLEAGLKHVLGTNQLAVYYQPQFDLERVTVIGTEALLRWNHPELGMVPPSTFIPVAEESGAIVPIGNWVMGEACRQTKIWQRSNAQQVRVAVNVSALQFHRMDLVPTVAAALERSGLDPSLLELELTETVLIQRVDEAAARMQQLRDLGVRIALDDFGTGYSSLSLLQRLPIDTIKIDKSFLDGIENGSSNISLVQAIVALAHSLGMSVVAEGIETQTQLEVLRTAGCDSGQGFLIGRPAPADAVRGVMAEAQQMHGRKTILLVEDEEMVLTLARRVLRKHGYNVLEARNGRDAITVCKKYVGEIDVLITDVRMPGMNGYDLKREIDRICPVPVIFVSGYGAQDESGQAERARFLGKPFSSDELLSAVRESLREDAEVN